MKLRLPNKLIAALLSTAAPALFSTLSTATLGAAAAAIVAAPHAEARTVEISEGESLNISELQDGDVISGSGTLVLGTNGFYSGASKDASKLNITFAEDWSGTVNAYGVANNNVNQSGHWSDNNGYKPHFVDLFLSSSNISGGTLELRSNAGQEVQLAECGDSMKEDGNYVFAPTTIKVGGTFRLSNWREDNTWVLGSGRALDIAGQLWVDHRQTLLIENGGRVVAKGGLRLGYDTSNNSADLVMSGEGSMLKVQSIVTHSHRDQSSDITITGGTVEFTPSNNNNVLTTNGPASVNIGATGSETVHLAATEHDWSLWFNGMNISNVTVDAPAEGATAHMVTLGHSGSTTNLNGALVNAGKLTLAGTLSFADTTYSAANTGTLVVDTTDTAAIKKLLFETTNTGTIIVKGARNLDIVSDEALNIGTGTVQLGHYVGGDEGNSVNMAGVSGISLAGGHLNIVGWGGNHYHALTAGAGATSTLKIFQHNNAQAGDAFVFEDTTTLNGNLQVLSSSAPEGEDYGSCSSANGQVILKQLSGAGTLIIGDANSTHLNVTVEDWHNFSGHATVNGPATLKSAALPTVAVSGDGRVEITSNLSGTTGTFSGVSAEEVFSGTLVVKRDSGDHNYALTLSHFSGVLELQGRIGLNASNLGSASKIVMNTEGVTNCTSLWANNGKKTITAALQIKGAGVAEINAGSDITINGALTGDTGSTFLVTTVNQTVTLAGNVEGFNGKYSIGGGALAFSVASGSQTISNAVSGTAIFRKTGNGTLNFSGDTSEFTGSFQINGGTMAFSVAGEQVKTLNNNFSGGGLLSAKGAGSLVLTGTLAAGMQIKNEGASGNLVLDNATLSSGNGRLNIKGGTITFRTGITDNTTEGNKYAVTVEGNGIADFTNGTFDFSSKNLAAWDGSTIKANSGSTLKVGALFWSPGENHGNVAVEKGGTLIVGAGESPVVNNNQSGKVRVKNFTNKGESKLHGFTNIDNVSNEGTLSLLGTESKTFGTFTQSGADAKLVLGEGLTLETSKGSGGSIEGSYDVGANATLNLKQLGADVTASLKDLTLAQNAVMGIYTDNTTSAAAEGDISVSGTLTSGSNATLNANLTLNNGATLAVAEGGLHMGSSVTIANGAKVSLSDNIISGLNSLTVGNGLTLFSGVDSFTLDGTAHTEDYTSSSASNYFNLAGVNRPWDFVIKYEANAADDGGKVFLYMETPEPATATLSLLALAALAAKRKRK